jgi:hypothetical protein
MQGFGRRVILPEYSTADTPSWITVPFTMSVEFSSLSGTSTGIDMCHDVGYNTQPHKSRFTTIERIDFEMGYLTAQCCLSEQYSP